MSYQNLILEKEDKLGIITLHRPERRNALSVQLKGELGRALDDLEQDLDIRVVILTGGDEVFCAGADIKERAKLDMAQADIYFDRKKNHRLFTRIEDFPKPVIAAVSGAAVGGGCELCLVCDLRLASDTARFGLPEVKMGAIPGAGGTQRLPRLIGATKAKELLFTGDFIEASEAYRIGLVNKVVPVKDLREEALAMGRKLAKQPPLALKFGKRAVNAGMQMDLASGLDYECYCAALLAVSEDRQEGFKAFVEKREPVFKGR